MERVKSTHGWGCGCSHLGPLWPTPATSSHSPKPSHTTTLTTFTPFLPSAPSCRSFTRPLGSPLHDRPEPQGKGGEC